MKLTNKLRTGILATTLTGLIGCAEFEELRDDFIESTTWEMAAAKLEKKGEDEKARAMRNMGNLRIARRIAEAGKSEVNVYTNGGREQQRTRWQLPENVILSSNGNYNPVQGYEWVNPKNNNDLRVRRTQNINYSNERVPDFFVANYWKDFNEDGIAEPKEIVGHMGGNKRDFNQGENVSFWISNSAGGTGTSLEFKIYNPKDEEIYSQTRRLSEGHWEVFPNGGGKGGFSPDYFKDKGTYIAFYSIDGKFKESIQFNIH